MQNWGNLLSKNKLTTTSLLGIAPHIPIAFVPQGEFLLSRSYTLPQIAFCCMCMVTVVRVRPPQHWPLRSLRVCLQWRSMKQPPCFLSSDFIKILSWVIISNFQNSLTMFVCRNVFLIFSKDATVSWKWLAEMIVAYFEIYLIFQSVITNSWETSMPRNLMMIFKD